MTSRASVRLKPTRIATASSRARRFSASIFALGLLSDLGAVTALSAGLADGFAVAFAAAFDLGAITAATEATAGFGFAAALSVVDFGDFGAMCAPIWPILSKPHGIRTYYILKNILDKSIELGFKHKQLIDMFHSNQLWHFDQPYKPTTKIRNWESWEKYVNGNIIDSKTINNSEEIIPSLYKKTYTSPARSYLWGVEKFKKGEYNLDYRTLFNILDK